MTIPERQTENTPGPAARYTLVTDKDREIKTLPPGSDKPLTKEEEQKQLKNAKRRQQRAKGRIEDPNDEKDKGYEYPWRPENYSPRRDEEPYDKTKPPKEGPYRGSDCHGFTFDHGESEIGSSDEVEKILKDNYRRKRKARVCDVIIYEKPPSHSGLVVEVDDDGNVIRVMSKLDSALGVFVHPPLIRPYEKVRIFRRKKAKDRKSRKKITAVLEPLEKAHEGAVKEYKKAQKELRSNPSKKDAVEKARRLCHEKARALCQTKNALARKP